MRWAYRVNRARHPRGLGATANGRHPHWRHCVSAQFGARLHGTSVWPLHANAAIPGSPPRPQRRTAIGISASTCQFLDQTLALFVGKGPALINPR